MSDSKGNEYKIVIDKAKKLVTHKKEETFMDTGSIKSSRKTLQRLHKDINVLQHNNTFTVEHEEPNGALKRQLRKAAKKVVSSALLPAMNRQSLYNETNSRSLLNLTVLSQNLFEYTFKKELSTTAQINYIKKNVGQIAQSVEQIEQRLSAIPAAGMRDVQGGKTTYSKAGEDAVLDCVLKEMGIAYANVSYVDIGVNHFRETSNTFYAYEQGAKGVLLEANPALVSNLRQSRGRDAIYNCIPAAQSGKKTVYMLNEDGLATMDLEKAKQLCQSNSALFIEKEIEVETRDMNEIVETYLGCAPTILSVNATGMWQSILAAWDFDRYRPTVLVVELPMLESLASALLRQNVATWLAAKDYTEYAFTGYSVLHINAKQGGCQK